MSLINIDSKILNKTFTNRVQIYSKMIIFHEYVGVFPEIQIHGWFNISTSINVMSYVNGLNDEIHKMISIDEVKGG